MESGIGKMTAEVGEKSAEKDKNSFEILRQKMWKALTIGSYALLLQACAPSREEIDAMPTTAVEDILKHGEELTGRPIIKVKGFVEDLGRKGEEEKYRFFLKERTTTHHYTLRSGPETNSSSVGMISEYEEDESGTSFADRVRQAIPPSFQSFNPAHHYEIVGTVMAKKDAKTTNYFLKIPRSGGTVDLTATKAEKEK